MLLSKATLPPIAVSPVNLPPIAIPPVTLLPITVVSPRKPRPTPVLARPFGSASPITPIGLK
jgi:hypothetical protein